MYDALTELADLSLNLQKQDITLPSAHNLLSRQVRVFSSMVDSPGPHSCEANLAVSDLSFQDVVIKPGSKADVAIHHGQFFRSLVNNIKKRMMTTRASGRSNAIDTLSYETEYEDLLRCINLLSPETWPDNIQEDITYGNADITILAKKLRLPIRQCIQGFRQFIDDGGKHYSDDILPLRKAIRSLVVSTADCERGFSQMNIVMTSSRTSLSIPRLSALMFIKCVGPPLNRFNPLPYVKTWLLKGHVTSNDTKARARNLNEPSLESINGAIWDLL
jgi:hypothetical protein